jgi:hypothetical protein
MPRIQVPSNQSESKRQNFNVTPEQEEELAQLRDMIGASSSKDLFLRATKVMSVLAREVQSGHSLYVKKQNELARLIIPELENMVAPKYEYLVERPHTWRRQYYVKGRRLLASTVMNEMTVNGLSEAEASQNWDLPLEAIFEIVHYCQANQPLLVMEADEERLRLIQDGVQLEVTNLASS